MSTETKFTPGPWEVWSDDEVYAESGGEKLVVVPDSTCGRDVYGADMVSRNESKHNAHLIAAAPELYEALIVARDYVQAELEMRKRSLAGHPQKWEVEERDLALINAALDKARGEA